MSHLCQGLPSRPRMTPHEAGTRRPSDPTPRGLPQPSTPRSSPIPRNASAGRDLDCVRGERPVFAGLGFALRPGEALVLVGPNGSGKSSLLRCMAGLLRPAGGELSWDGVAIDADPEAHRARLHYAGHLDAIKAVLSVAENLRFW